MDVEKFSQKQVYGVHIRNIKKYIKNYNEINSSRGRDILVIKMSLINLIVHSFSIIAVFRYQSLLRSCIIVLDDLFEFKFWHKFIFF